MSRDGKSAEITSRETRMETSRGIESHLVKGEAKRHVTCEGDESGGSKNRTCDLSIISAAL